jgi:hypothetical protein
MGIMPAWVTTTNTKKRKQKFKSAEEKRRVLAQQESWENLKRKYDVKPKTNLPVVDNYQPKRSLPPRGESVHYPSRDTGLGSAGTLKPKQVYTGTKIIGIGTLHKSNAVPVFSDEEAKDIARMRRG